MGAGLALGILAGGRGGRMGGRDKGWIEYGGQALVQRQLDALRAPFDQVLVSANRNLDAYRALGVQVVEDRWAGHHGPLAGIASLLEATRQPWLLTVPVDSVDLPGDYVQRMAAFQSGERLHVVVAEDDDGLQPLFARYPAALAAHAVNSFEAGVRSVRDWQYRFPVYPCRFRGCRFGNLNSPEDLTA